MSLATKKWLHELVTKWPFFTSVLYSLWIYKKKFLFVKTYLKTTLQNFAFHKK